MKRETTGTEISVSEQWWLKINTKAIRKGPMDGAVFPYIIKVSYMVAGKEYVRRKWISAGAPVPMEGSSVKVVYNDDAPAKADIICQSNHTFGGMFGEGRMLNMQSPIGVS